jgi:hypothetical protein
MNTTRTHKILPCLAMLALMLWSSSPSEAQCSGCAAINARFRDLLGPEGSQMITVSCSRRVEFPGVTFFQGVLSPPFRSSHTGRPVAAAIITTAKDTLPVQSIRDLGAVWPLRQGLPLTTASRARNAVLNLTDRTRTIRRDQIVRSARDLDRWRARAEVPDSVAAQIHAPRARHTEQGWYVDLYAFVPGGVAHAEFAITATGLTVDATVYPVNLTVPTRSKQ